MKRWRGVVVAAVLLVPAAAPAQPVPSVTCLVEGAVLPATRSLFARMTVGTITLDLTPCLRGSGKVHQLAADFILGGVATGRVTALYNEDPFINFGIATSTLVAGPLDFMFIFSTPIVPGLYTNATSSIAGSLTAGQTPATLTNTPGAPAGTIPFLRGNGTVGGVPVSPGLGVFTTGNLGVDVGFGPCTTPGPSVNCPAAPALGANAFAPTFYDDLDAIVSYRQGGLQSQASFTGRVEILSSTVPEPATVSLLALGMMVLGAGALARRRQG